MHMHIYGNDDFQFNPKLTPSIAACCSIWPRAASSNSARIPCFSNPEARVRAIWLRPSVRLPILQGHKGPYRETHPVGRTRRHHFGRYTQAVHGVDEQANSELPDYEERAAILHSLDRRPMPQASQSPPLSTLFKTSRSEKNPVQKVLLVQSTTYPRTLASFCYSGHSDESAGPTLCLCKRRKGLRKKQFFSLHLIPLSDTL